MPIQTTQDLTLIPPDHPSPGSVKNAAQTLQMSSANSADAKLWSAASQALFSVQRQLDAIFNLLKSPIPTQNPVIVTDATGIQQAAIGDMVDLSANKAFQGAWLKTPLLCGTGPASANGTSGQVLTSQGPGVAPVWAGAASSGVSHVSNANPWFGTPTGSRQFNTVYFNGTGIPLMVTLAVASGASPGTYTVVSDTNSNPTTTIIGNLGISNQELMITFWVLPSNYYKVSQSGGTTGIWAWTEWY